MEDSNWVGEFDDQGKLKWIAPKPLIDKLNDSENQFWQDAMWKNPSKTFAVEKPTGQLWWVYQFGEKIPAIKTKDGSFYKADHTVADYRDHNERYHFINSDYYLDPNTITIDRAWTSFDF